MFDEILKSKASRICIIAAPGSGKTKRALMPKVKQVLEDPSIDPKEVLLLTFSRLSAKDLKSRVSSMERVPRASTVHSLCLAFLLSENSHDMRKRVESIVLDFEKDVLLDDLKLIFPQISKPKLRNTLSKFGAGWATQPHDEVFEKNDTQKSFKAAVINWLNEYEAVIMEEIVYGAVELAKKLGTTDFIKSPQHIFVDEYQDLNKLEQEFIELLAADSKLVFIVGDPDQSIYSFKYSYPEGIKDYSTQSGVEFYQSHETGRCPKKVVDIANQLLIQADPARTNLLKSVSTEEGEVNFIQKETQNSEFEYILQSISKRLKNGSLPENIMVLVPKKALGAQFVKYSNTNKDSALIPEGIKFKFDSKIELTLAEQERILLLGMLVKPDSLLHIRSYLALGSTSSNAKEVRLLKSQYGDLISAMKNADPDDFPIRKRLVRATCKRILELRDFLSMNREGRNIKSIIDELFPVDNDEIKSIRSIIDELLEEDDTLENLYSKLIDHMRVVPTSNSDIRVMTLMGSKGLDADHVYILGCNSGNLPGSNRSSHLTDQQHKEEQRRLLFVGVTRAIKSLTISWARLIPFSQSRQHHTRGLRSVRQTGQPIQTLLGMSEFLQDLTGITWEN